MPLPLPSESFKGSVLTHSASSEKIRWKIFPAEGVSETCKGKMLRLEQESWRQSVCGGANTELQSSSQRAKEKAWRAARSLAAQPGAQHCSSCITNGTSSTVPLTAAHEDLSLPPNHLHFAVDFHSELSSDFGQSSSKTTSDLFLVV